MRRAATKRQEDYIAFKFLIGHGSVIATLIKICAGEYKLSVVICRCEIYNDVQNNCPANASCADRGFIDRWI